MIELALIKIKIFRQERRSHLHTKDRLIDEELIFSIIHVQAIANDAQNQIF